MIRNECYAGLSGMQTLGSHERRTERWANSKDSAWQCRAANSKRPVVTHTSLICVNSCTPTDPLPRSLHHVRNNARSIINGKRSKGHSIAQRPSTRSSTMKLVNTGEYLLWYATDLYTAQASSTRSLFASHAAYSGRRACLREGAAAASANAASHAPRSMYSSSKACRVGLARRPAATCWYTQVCE